MEHRSLPQLDQPTPATWCDDFHSAPCAAIGVPMRADARRVDQPWRRAPQPLLTPSPETVPVRSSRPVSPRTALLPTDAAAAQPESVSSVDLARPSGWNELALERNESARPLAGCRVTPRGPSWAVMRHSARSAGPPTGDGRLDVAVQRTVRHPRRKAHYEEGNAHQCSPTGGEPHRHC